MPHLQLNRAFGSDPVRGRHRYCPPRPQQEGGCGGSPCLPPGERNELGKATHGDRWGIQARQMFFHLISFGWRRDGRWHYEENEKRADLEIKIPLPDGKEVAIKHLLVDTSKETLGVFTCPSGKAKGQITLMNDKAQEWIDRAKEGHLSHRDVWFLQDHQLWPKLGYALGSLSAPWRELDDCLRQKWWQIVPMGGIIRSAPHQIRDMDLGFYGGGCKHVGVECLVAQANKMLMHYGCPSNDGLKLQASLEYLMIELGMSAQPLQVSYKRHESWVTEGWWKSFWEKCDLFSIQLIFNNIPINLQGRGVVPDHYFVANSPVVPTTYLTLWLRTY